jgi:hypothetical protein
MIDYKKLELDLINWTKETVNSFGTDSVLIEFESGHVNNNIIYNLCEKARFKKIHIITWDKISEEFLKLKSNMHHYKFNLNKLFNEMTDSAFLPQAFYIPFELLDTAKINRICYLSQILNAVTIGSYSRNEYLFVRNYSKFHGMDILPLADLKQSVLDNLSKNVYNFSPDVNRILFGTDITNEEIEWIDNLNERTKIIDGVGIIDSIDDPAKNKKWFTFTLQQKELIGKVHQMEKMTRHKHNPNMPIFKGNI